MEQHDERINTALSWEQNYFFCIAAIYYHNQYHLHTLGVAKGEERILVATWIVNRSYHMSNSHQCMGVNGKALCLCTVYKKPCFLLQVVQDFVSVLQVTWQSGSGTASDARCVWTCNKIEVSYDKIIITIVPSYTRKKTSLACCHLNCYCCCVLVMIQTATNL